MFFYYYSSCQKEDNKQKINNNKSTERLWLQCHIQERCVCVFCVLAHWACVRAPRRWGEGSLCNLKGKYKAHKAGSAGRQQERQGKARKR